MPMSSFIDSYLLPSNRSHAEAEHGYGPLPRDPQVRPMDCYALTPSAAMTPMNATRRHEACDV